MLGQSRIQRNQSQVYAPLSGYYHYQDSGQRLYIRASRSFAKSMYIVQSVFDEDVFSLSFALPHSVSIPLNMNYVAWYVNVRICYLTFGIVEYRIICAHLIPHNQIVCIAENVCIVIPAPYNLMLRHSYQFFEVLV